MPGKYAIGMRVDRARRRRGYYQSRHEPAGCGCLVFIIILLATAGLACVAAL